MRPGRAADHSLPSSAAVMKEYSYISTHPLGHTGPVTGSLYLYLCDCIFRSVMNNSVSNTVMIEFSECNESYRNWLDLPLNGKKAPFDVSTSYISLV